MNNAFELLIKSLNKLPGVGQRQAKRFAYALTKNNNHLANEVINIVKSLDGKIFSCILCGATSLGNEKICTNCDPKTHDLTTLTLVANQEDYDSLVNIKKYRGLLAIAPFPGKIELAENTDPLTGSYLSKTISYWKEKGLEEIIMAYPISPEGEIMESMTIDFLENIKLNFSIKVTSLGRGMSLGSRLSEVDDETINYALGNRKRAI